MTGRRARRRAVLVALVLGGALLASGAPGWFSVEVVTLLQGEVRLTASGAQAVPALTGLGLVLLAAGAALGISGPVGRRVVGGFLLLAGVAAGWLVLAAVRSPGAALRRTVAEHTGVGVVPEGVATSPWPFLTLGLAVVVVAVGIAHVLGAGPWPEPGARVRRGADRAADEPRADVTNDPTSTWDALSDGDDPTSPGRLP